MDGKAVLKEEVGRDLQKERPFKIDCGAFVSDKEVKKPVPVFLLINNRGKENTDPTK